MSQQSTWIWLWEGHSVWRERWRSPVWGDLGLDTAHLTACKCTVTNIICLKAVPPLIPHTSGIQEGIKGLLHLMQCVCSKVHQARHCVSKPSLGEVMPPTPRTGLSFVLIDCCNLMSRCRHQNNSFSKGQWHPGQQLTVQFLWLESQCMNSPPAGIVTAHIGWASSTLLSEGLSS